MLTGNKYKKNLENQRFICILVKNPYIMILLAQYLLAGVIIGFLIEHVIRWAGDNVDFGERIQMIMLWPIVLVVFVYHFIKGLLGHD